MMKQVVKMGVSAFASIITSITCIVFLFTNYSFAFDVQLSPVQRCEPDGASLAKSAFSDPNGAVYNIYNRPLHSADDPDIEPLPVQLVITNESGKAGELTVNLWATNHEGIKIDWNQQTKISFTDGEKSKNIVFGFKGGTGTFDIHADIIEKKSNGLAKELRDAAVLRVASVPVWSGVRKNSFFSINNHTCGTNWAFYKSIGMKIIRIWPANKEEAMKNDCWILPVAGGSTPSNIDAFIDGVRSTYNANKDFTMVEFLNEPWIFGWVWQRSAADYRDAHGKWCKMAKEVLPKAITFANSSIMLFQDVVEGWPECYKGYLDAICDHPYDPCGHLNTMRPGSMLSSFDGGIVIARRSGVPYSGLTEGGQWATLGKNSPETAWQIADYFLMSYMTGHILGCCECDQLGVGPGWTLPNNAFALVAYFLEDRAPLADIWPYNEFLFGMIIGHKKFADDYCKKLPRGQDIQARWQYDGRSDDNTLVAVMFAHTGEHNRSIDDGGKLVISGAPADMKACDYLGTEIKGSGGTFDLPLTRKPVYLSTTSLGVKQFRELIRNGKISGPTPLNMYALSLTKPANQKQEMIVRIQNQMPFSIEGTLTIEPLGSGKTSSSEFKISEGRLKEVRIEWPGVTTLNDKNVYGIKMTATSKNPQTGEELKKVTRQHLINSAIIFKKTIEVDGNLQDWNDVTPVILDCRQCNVDIESNLETFIPTIGNGSVVAKVWVAYDDKYVYVAAQMKDPGWGNSSGGSGPGGFPIGVPGGIFTPCRYGDVFMFAFGFRPRVPGMGRELDEPWCWKGQFYDTDYLYFAYPSQQGDQFVSIWKGDTPIRRYGYQTSQLPEHAKVPGGKISMRNGIYECAIPRSEIPLFDPSKFDRCRFGFVYSNNEKASKIDWYDNKDDMDNKMQYSRGYGVFDHWNKYAGGSFVPTWVPFAPCQTQFGVEGGVPAVAGSIYFMPDETPLGGEASVNVTSASSIFNNNSPGVLYKPLSTEKIFNRNRN